MKSLRGPAADGYVIRMAGDAVLSIRHDHVGPEVPDESFDARQDVRLPHEFQLSVGTAPERHAFDAERAAGVLQLGLSHVAQLLGPARAVREARLSAREGEEAHADAPARVEGDGGRIAEGLVIRMRIDVKDGASGVRLVHGAARGSASIESGRARCFG